MGEGGQDDVGVGQRAVLVEDLLAHLAARLGHVLVAAAVGELLGAGLARLAQQLEALVVVDLGAEGVEVDVVADGADRRQTDQT